MNKDREIIANALIKIFEEDLELRKKEKITSNIFKIKVKNLLAFNLLLANLTESVNIIFKDVDKDYIISKYKHYISNNIDENKIIEYVKSVKRLEKPDLMISKYENIFGKNSFLNISDEPNYTQGLHIKLKTEIFDVYVKNLLPKSRKYKIYMLFNQTNP